MNTPIPASVSYPPPQTELSLISEALTWNNLSTKLPNGKTVPYFASIGGGDYELGKVGYGDEQLN
jgi:hypothetical protein